MCTGEAKDSVRDAYSVVVTVTFVGGVVASVPVNVMVAVDDEGTGLPPGKLVLTVPWQLASPESVPPQEEVKPTEAGPVELVILKLVMVRVRLLVLVTVTVAFPPIEPQISTPPWTQELDTVRFKLAADMETPPTLRPAAPADASEMVPADEPTTVPKAVMVVK